MATVHAARNALTSRRRCHRPRSCCCRGPQVLEKAECEALGMGLYLGVAEAADEPPKFIHLTYTPGGALRCAGLRCAGLGCLRCRCTVPPAACWPAQLPRVADEASSCCVHACVGAGEVKKNVAIVGKGLTFDSGGYNLKAGAGSMIEMMKFE